MDVAVISPGNGAAALQQENEMDNSLAERFCHETQPVSQSEQSEQESIWNSSSFSVIRRWYKRCTQLKAMEGKIQQLCQDDTQAIADLGFLSPSAFKFTCGTIRCEKCACATCDALVDLKETCESFVISKQERVHAEKEHAEAKKEYAEAEKKRADAETQDTDAENRMTPNDPSAKKDMTLELHAVVVALKAASVAHKAKSVFKDANAMYLAHTKVRCLLEALRTAGNGTSLVFSSHFDSAKSSDDSSNATIDLEVGSSSSQIAGQFDALCHLSELKLDMIDFLPTLDADHQALLDPLYNHLKLIVGTAIVLQSKDKNYRKKISATIKSINEWNPTKPADKTKYYAPGCECQERDGTQPLLFAIMVKMAHVMGLERHITREQEICEVENRPARRVDLVVARVEEHALAVIPATLGIPIEVKPTTRKTTGVGRLLLDAQDQLIGHLAKRALCSFDFAGIGEDCQVFGLELTMGSVAVIVVELSGVGTCDVKITTKRTKPVPLFDAETRRHLFGETVKEVDSSLSGSKEQDGLPAGFCLLARMLMSVQPGVGTSLTKTSCCRNLSVLIDNAESVRVGPHLGSGAHAHVFELELNDTKDAFVKVPKSHQVMRSLEREAEALGALPAREGIPQLQDTKQPIKTLDVRIRCEISAMPCLPLRGLIGRPASQHPWDSEDWKFIFLEVYAILKFAHDQGWAHLDVRLSNIITNGVSDSHRGPLKVMLIDWGCARRTDSKLMKFVGCPPYAHDELFGLANKGWTPCLDHDLASLVYSVASAYHGGIPWSGFSNHCAVPVDVRKCRNKVASDVLKRLSKEWGLPPEMKEELLKAIGSKGNTKFRGNLCDRLGWMKRNRSRR